MTAIIIVLPREGQPNNFLVVNFILCNSQLSLYLVSNTINHYGDKNISELALNRVQGLLRNSVIWIKGINYSYIRSIESKKTYFDFVFDLVILSVFVLGRYDN